MREKSARENFLTDEFFIEPPPETGNLQKKRSCRPRISLRWFLLISVLLVGLLLRTIEMHQHGIALDTVESAFLPERRPGCVAPPFQF